jgi:hypothetical protein
MKTTITIFTLVLGLAAFSQAAAEINRSEYAEDDIYVTVLGEDWYPEGFEHGMSVPATYLQQADIRLDGIDDEPEWQLAQEVLVPLQFGTTGQALVKVLYTDEMIHFRVRWPDATEDRDHQPWVWNEEAGEYVAGPQIEDSILLSIEAGCNWNPSLLAGYQYDFDGWHWRAARSDPVGQAWDMMGNIADQDHPALKPTPYPSRVTENSWNVKFLEYYGEEISHQPWQELDRSYMFRPVRPVSYVRTELDGMGVTVAGERLPAPAAPPSDTENLVVPSIAPPVLEGDAGEIGAKGNWQDGYWTVEFSRTLTTPGSTANDSVFNRLTQFSIHVFDQTERVDQSSESKRLFLEFLPENPRLAIE